MATAVPNSSQKKFQILNFTTDQSAQNQQIKKIFSDALIILSAMTFIGTAIAWVIVPIAISSLSIIATSIFTAFAVGLVLRNNPNINIDDSDELPNTSLTPSHDTSAKVESKEEELPFNMNEIPDLDPDQHFEQISKIFEDDNAKIYYFLSNRLKFDHAYLKLGHTYFSKSLLTALAHAKKLDGYSPGWENDIILQLARIHVAQPTPQFAADSNKARPEEVASFSKGLHNPSGNCFMHASLQALFQNKDLAAMILSQLQTIAESEKYNQRQKITTTDCLIVCENQKEQVDLLAHKDAMIADLVKDRRILEIKNLDSYSFEDVEKLDFSKEDNLVRLYITCSLKEAAVYTHALLHKWQNSHVLNGNESKLLRLSMIKLMNRPNSIILDKTSFLSLTTYKARWKIPGLHGDFSIRPELHEDASLFTRNILESLNALSHDIDPSLKTSEHLITVQRTIKAYRLPEEPEEGKDPVPVFDPSLAITGAETEFTQVLSAYQPVAHLGTFKLDDLSFLSEYRSYEKPNVTYKASENLPGTNVGDTVSEKYHYRVALPSKLIAQLNIFDYSKAGGTKHSKTVVEFTNEDALTVTFPKDVFFDEDQTYRLDSFVVHLGSNLRAGHYFTYTRVVRDSDGSSYWIKQNDDTVEPCSCHEALSVLKGQISYLNAFMLIFSKV
jgi:Ubiquitin carboxyl-terminal hydrolase